MSSAWIQVAAARRDLADLVETLSPQQQQGPTLCAGWTPHHVLAHVTSFVELPLPRYLFGVVRAGGNVDKMADATAKRLAEQPVDELAAILRAKADKKNPLPTFPAEMTLTSFDFKGGRTLTLYGMVSPDDQTRVTEYNSEMRRAAVDGVPLFAQGRIKAPSFTPMPGGQYRWDFSGELKQSSAE